MTVEEIKKCKFDMLTAQDVSEVIGANPQAIRDQAQSDISKLGFKCVVVDNRLRIPRKAFLEFLCESN